MEVFSLSLFKQRNSSSNNKKSSSCLVSTRTLGPYVFIKMKYCPSQVDMPEELMDVMIYLIIPDHTFQYISLYSKKNSIYVT